MPICRSCGTTVETADLVRHEFAGLLLVHCPVCHAAMGTYHTDRPRSTRALPRGTDRPSQLRR